MTLAKQQAAASYLICPKFDYKIQWLNIYPRELNWEIEVTMFTLKRVMFQSCEQERGSVCVSVVPYWRSICMWREHLTFGLKGYSNWLELNGNITINLCSYPVKAVQGCTRQSRFPIFGAQSLKEVLMSGTDRQFWRKIQINTVTGYQLKMRLLTA